MKTSTAFLIASTLVAGATIYVAYKLKNSFSPEKSIDHKKKCAI